MAAAGGRSGTGARAGDGRGGGCRGAGARRAGTGRIAIENDIIIIMIENNAMKIKASFQCERADGGKATRGGRAPREGPRTGCRAALPAARGVTLGRFKHFENRRYTNARRERERAIPEGRGRRRRERVPSRPDAVQSARGDGAKS